MQPRNKPDIVESAAARAQRSLDTIRAVETPEGVDLRLHLAGPVPRAAALAIDLLIRALIYIVLAFLAGLSGLGIGLMLIGFFATEWFYPVFYELRRGATPGKKAMGLLVIHADGTPIGPSASMLRNLLRVVDFLPILYGAGLVSTLIDPQFRRLGDLAAGTLVVYAERIDTKRQLPVMKPFRPSQTLDLTVQRAILDYAERSPSLSLARNAELAELLTDADGLHGTDATERVIGIANWLARGR